MVSKKENKENTQHVGLRMPIKLVEKIDEIYYFNKTDRSTEIIRACEQYVECYFLKQESGVAEPESIYASKATKEEVRVANEEIARLKIVIDNLVKMVEEKLGKEI